MTEPEELSKAQLVAQALNANVDAITPMYKHHVALYCGVSVRTVERWMNNAPDSGRPTLACDYEKADRGGQVAIFNPDVVYDFKRAMEQQASAASLRRLVKTSGPTETLARRSDRATPTDQLAIFNGLAPLLAAIPRFSLNDQDFPHPDKLTLTIDEAVSLSGLPKSFLKGEVKNGRLKRVAGVHAILIRRSVLKEFVARL